ncbi:MAG: AEC family transporter [Lachnospiraceae bacterium]
MDIQVTFQVMLKLFIILVIGYVLNKTDILDQATNKKISKLIVNVTAPMLIVSSIASAENDNRETVLLLLAAGFVAYVAVMILGWLLLKILPFPKEDRPAYECMMVFSNNAFMGYPVVEALFGTQAIFYCAMFNFSFNIFIYSYAVMRMTAGKGGRFDWKEQVKKMINPGMILTICALLIYLLQIPITGVVKDTVDMVGGITSPLSMLSLGAAIAVYPLAESVKDLRCYGFALIRLVVLPIVAAVVCNLLKVPELFKGIIVVTYAMPVASLVLMQALQYNANAKIVTRNIMVTTVLSVVTIPVMVSILL